MGNSHSFADTYAYHTAVAQATEGSTPVYRASSHPTELVHNFLDCEVKSSWDLFNFTVKRFPNRKFLGRRFRDEDGQLGEFEWMTYSEAHQIALAFGSALLKNSSLIPFVEFPEEVYPGAQKMRLLGLYAKNCVEWFLAEQACNAYNITLCPLYDTLGAEAMEFILLRTKMVTCLVAFESFENLLQVLADPKDPTKVKDGIQLRNVILIDPTVTDTYRRVSLQYKSVIERGQRMGVEVILWHEIVSPATEHFPVSPGTLEEVNTLCYTSGTTGLPKGAILTHKLVTSVVVGACRGPINPAGNFEVSQTDCVLSYLPLAHVFERCVCQIVITRGGAIGVYSGDMSRLLDDVKVLRPTVFLSVPRLFNRINDKVALSLMEKNLPTQILFNQGLHSKINRRRSDSITTHKVWDTVVFGKIRSMMGGRLRGMICGGAPLDRAICERMTAYFGAPLMQGYGLSESFGPCFLMHANDSEAGYVGGVWPAVEFKLVSIPELKYFVTDHPPKGELCLRGPGVSPGYFLSKEDNKAWDEEGWFHTGDVAAMHEKTKAIAIIDRKKNIFKLSQGEYVAPEKIEAVYGQALSVGQIFVFGYSHQTCLVAIVHPDLEFANSWAEKNNVDSDTVTLCKNQAFKQVVLQDLEAVGKKLGLKGFEKVRDIHLTPEPFTVENQLLTPTSKLRRAECRHRYESQINSLYAKITS